MAKSLNDFAKAEVLVRLDGQSRPRIRAGSPARMVEGDIVGIATNPAIFAKAAGMTCSGPCPSSMEGAARVQFRGACVATKADQERFHPHHQRNDKPSSLGGATT